MASLARSTVYLNERLLGDLGGLARENPDSNQFMHQTAYAALRPLVMMSLGCLKTEMQRRNDE